MSLWTDIMDVIGAAGGNAYPAETATGQAVASNSGLLGFFTALTDGYMWRSLGWIILGVVLMILGVALLTKEHIPPQLAAAAALA